MFSNIYLHLYAEFPEMFKSRIILMSKRSLSEFFRQSNVVQLFHFQIITFRHETYIERLKAVQVKNISYNLQI